jgi:YVTN family beta-propeller protein
VNQLTGKVYVADFSSNTVSVINPATNAVTATIPVGSEPVGVAVNQLTGKIYVTNTLSNTVSVIIPPGRQRRHRHHHRPPW